jgi:hypothetical protein
MHDDERRMNLLRRLVKEQVFDDGLWCKCERASEQHMQNAIRLLHRVARDVDVAPLEKIHWND